MKLFLVKLLGKLLTKTVYDIMEYGENRELIWVYYGVSNKKLKKLYFYKKIDFEKLYLSTNMSYTITDPGKTFKVKAMRLPTCIGKLWIRIRRK